MRLTNKIKGTTLAVGTLSGKLHIFDAHTLQRQRTYQQAHLNRIGALSWNAHILSSGSRDRNICHRDVREATIKPFKKSLGHKQEVCGLRWNTDGGPSNALLASGGNDNKVCIWDLRGSKRPGAASAPPLGPSGSTSTGGSGPTAGSEDASDLPVWKFHEHTAAVKALAWDPHVNGILASGGGTADKHIRFWNVSTGSMLSEFDTGSQVRQLLTLDCDLYTDFLSLSPGLQPHMVTYIPRTGLHPWFLINHSAEPNMYMEIPVSGYGSITDGTYTSSVIPGHESGRRDNRHWCRRRNSTILELIPEEGQQPVEARQSTGLWPSNTLDGMAPVLRLLLSSLPLLEALFPVISRLTAVSIVVFISLGTQYLTLHLHVSALVTRHTTHRHSHHQTHYSRPSTTIHTPSIFLSCTILFRSRPTVVFASSTPFYDFVFFFCSTSLCPQSRSCSLDSRRHVVFNRLSSFHCVPAPCFILCLDIHFL